MGTGSERREKMPKKRNEQAPDLHGKRLPKAGSYSGARAQKKIFLLYTTNREE
jgi:hypothetical protein